MLASTASDLTEAVMSRRKKDPLRELTDPERLELTQLSRSQVAPAVEVTRAGLLLAVARGDDYQDAARSLGRRSGDAVAHLVARFNAEGTAALTPRHGGGRKPTYDPAARARIAAEAARAPSPEADGTATRSLTTLRRTPRAAPDGLPAVSTYTIRRVLHESGSSYQRTRTWCPTGTAVRRRKAGPAVVADPDPDAKKS
jgi:transposase